MYSYDWNQLFYELQQSLIQKQEKINQLEKRIEQLEKDHLNYNQPSIEKIEYKFDQLKIETLTGSLHIGLSPDELKNMEDFSLPQAPTTSIQAEPIQRQILADLESYIHEEGNQLIHDLALKNNYQLDESSIPIMLEDIRKQLSNRIQFYEQEVNKNPLPKDEKQKYIQAKIKEEIRHSLSQFIQSRKEKGEEK